MYLLIIYFFHSLSLYSLSYIQKLFYSTLYLLLLYNLPFIWQPGIGAIQVLQHNLILISYITDLICHFSFQYIPHYPVLQEPTGKFLKDQFILCQTVIILWSRHDVLFQHPEPTNLFNMSSIIFSNLKVQILILIT